MIFRVYIANLTAEQVARIGQSLDMAGTVFSGVGFGAWGIESTTVAELGGITREQIGRFVEAIFAAAPAEEAVYVHNGESGEVWYRDGRVE